MLTWLKILDIWVWHHKNMSVSHSHIHSVFFEDILGTQGLYMDCEQTDMVWDPVNGVHNLVGYR